MLTRQQRRQAERRLRKDRFPFPEKHLFLFLHLKNNPEYFAQSDPETR